MIDSLPLAEWESLKSIAECKNGNKKAIKALFSKLQRHLYCETLCDREKDYIRRCIDAFLGNSSLDQAFKLHKTLIGKPSLVAKARLGEPEELNKIFKILQKVRALHEKYKRENKKEPLEEAISDIASDENVGVDSIKSWRKSHGGSNKSQE